MSEKPFVLPTSFKKKIRLKLVLWLAVWMGAVLVWGIVLTKAIGV
jgi:hypothetical protein